MLQINGSKMIVECHNSGETKCFWYSNNNISFYVSGIIRTSDCIKRATTVIIKIP